VSFIVKKWLFFANSNEIGKKKKKNDKKKKKKSRPPGPTSCNGVAGGATGRPNCKKD